MSNGKRVALGIGVIILGVSAALPFRYAQPREQWLSTTEDRGLSLGDDVALQVPGQAATPPHFQPLPMSPDTEEFREEPEPTTHQPPATDSPLLDSSPPPSLPDQYLPLMANDAPAASSTARIVRPSTTDDSPPARPRYHTIHDGDTLESLALRYYDDANKADWIRQANSAILAVPGLLPVGQEIMIPDGTQLPAAGRLRAATAAAADPDSDSVAETLVPLPSGFFQHSPQGPREE